MGSSSKASKKPSTASSAGSRRGEMYTMASLESAVRTNPHNLLMFAAQKDFSGENISFLMKVMDWKRGWLPTTPTNIGYMKKPRAYESYSNDLQRQQFKGALDIYASCVSPRYSYYPINLSHVHLKELETVFEGASMMTHADIGLGVDNATPFDQLWRSPTHDDIENWPGKDGSSMISARPTNGTNKSTENILGPTDAKGGNKILQAYELTTVSDRLPDFIPIPSEFGPEVFDRAEESIKYMVLTNTWPKFVKDRCASNTDSSRGTFFNVIRNKILAK